VLHAAITAQKNGEVFADPVTEAIASDYDEMVVEPMDLRTIKQNIRQGLITNTTEYERAIFLMFANAVMYNLPGSETYDMAKGVSGHYPYRRTEKG
jgi:bromodomain-containing protein 8